MVVGRRCKRFTQSRQIGPVRGLQILKLDAQNGEADKGSQAKGGGKVEPGHSDSTICASSAPVVAASSAALTCHDHA